MAKGKSAFFVDDDFTVETPVEETPVVETPVVPMQPVEDLDAYVSPAGTQGRKGQKTPRMNLAIPENVYEIIRRESRKRGMTYSEFLCALVLQWKSNNK